MPTTTIATSAAAAAAAASARAVVGVGGAAPSSSPLTAPLPPGELDDEGVVGAGVERSRVARTSLLPNPKNDVPRSRSSHASMRTSPSSSTRVDAVVDRPNVHSPGSSTRIVPVSRAENRRGSSRSVNSPSHNARALRNVVLSAASPSSSRLSNRSMVMRPASAVASRIESVLVAIGPRANVRVTSSGSAAAMPARGVTGGCGSSAALPPPMIQLASAAVPMSAIEPMCRAVERQLRVVVLQEHEALGRGLADERPVRGIVDGARARRRPRRRTAPVRSASTFSRSTIRSTVARVDVARFDRVGEGAAEPLRRSGHLEVEAGVGRGRGAVGAEPVGDHEAVEAPLVAQDPW